MENEKNITEVCFGLDEELLGKYEGRKDKNFLALSKVCAFYSDNTFEIVDFNDLDARVDKSIFVKEAKDHLVDGGQMYSAIIDSDRWNNAVMRAESIKNAVESTKESTDLTNSIPDVEEENVVSEDASVENTDVEPVEGEEVELVENENGGYDPIDGDIPEASASDSQDEAGNESTEDEEEKSDGDTLKKAALVGGTVLAGGAIIAAGMALESCEDKALTKDNTVIESNIDDIKEVKVEVPDMTGKDFEYYKENAIETTQKDVFVNKMSAWLDNTNGKEDWEKITLTEEEQKQYEVASDEFVFGFTSEEAFALVMRYGNYSEQEMLNITGGKTIDIDQTIEYSNNAIKNAITYYVLSSECKLGIDTLINFDESGVKVIESFENLLAQYKAVEFEEGKEEEALALMKQIKKGLVELAHDDQIDGNTKNWTLNTIGSACVIISNNHQYKDKIELNVYNNKTESNEIIEIKTDLFDELTTRDLFLGYDKTFDSEAYLEENKIDPKQYNLLYTDLEKGFADIDYSTQKSNLENFNKYANERINENVAAEALVQFKGQIEGADNVTTEFDNVTHGTYDFNTLNDMLDDYLIKKNTYPIVHGYDSNSLYSKKMNMFFKKITDQQIAYKNTHGITAGKVGDIIKDVENAVINAPLEEILEKSENIVVVDSNGNESTLEKEKAKAVEKENKEKNIISEAEAKKEAVQEQVSAQSAYDAGFAYGYGNGSYEAKYAESSDAIISSSWSTGFSDGQVKKNNEAQAGQVTGGETIINEEYKDADTKDNKAEVDLVNSRIAKEEAKKEEEAKKAKDTAIVDSTPSSIPEVAPQAPVSEGFSSSAPSGFAPVVEPVSEAPSDDIVVNPEYDGADTLNSLSAAASLNTPLMATFSPSTDTTPNVVFDTPAPIVEPEAAAPVAEPDENVQVGASEDEVNAWLASLSDEEMDILLGTDYDFGQDLVKSK